jgi:hypothetical protein
MNHLSTIAPLMLAAGCSTGTHIAGPLESPDTLVGRITLSGSPLGITWGMIYGPPAIKQPARFLPAVKQLGGGFTKVNLFWSQLEPQPGRYDWELLDAYLDQLASPDEGLLALFSASPWATRTSAWFLPPSPAKDLDQYYRFVHEVAVHAKGRVRYFQNDSEPNNPIFWAGTKEDYVAQLRTFYRAVKEADPQALVVLGGCDGLFAPRGEDPIPGQEASLAFFDHVLAQAGGSFDVFDLHLYADPYTIPGRVPLMRQKMSALGLVKPIVTTEYNGPGFFEFPANRHYFGLLQSWGQSLAAGDAERPPAAGNPPNGIADLYQRRDTLAPQTQMFLQGCPDDLERKLRRLQARDLVMRNVLALAAGVQKTAYWDLWHDTSQRDDLTTLLYGKLKLMEYADGELKQRYPTADAFARMAAALDGLQSVQRIPVGGRDSIYLFEVKRRGRGSLFVAWERRDAFTGEDEPAVSVAWETPAVTATAVDALAHPVPVTLDRGRLRIELSLTPVFIEVQK